MSNSSKDIVQALEAPVLKSRRAVFRVAGGVAAAALLAACKSNKDGDPTNAPTGGGNADSGY